MTYSKISQHILQHGVRNKGFKQELKLLELNTFQKKKLQRCTFSLKFINILTMDLSGIPTPHMDWESNNLPASWKKFKQHCELIFAGPLKQKSEEVKVTYLLMDW